MTTWTSQTVMDAIKVGLTQSDCLCVKHAAIVKATGLTGRQVADACAKLEKHGYLQRELYSDDTVKPGCYKLTELGLRALDAARLTSGPKQAHGKPRACPDSLRDRAWRTLRIRMKASVPELVGLLLDANVDGDAFTRAQNNLHKYIRALLQAGYLTEMRRESPTSPTSNGVKRYMLTRDTGPLPPLSSPKRVYDQNEKKHYDYQ